MKKLTLLLLLALIIASCTKKEDALVLPPENSMEMDFSSFTSTKSAEITEGTIINHAYAGLNIAFWNTVLYVNLAVPVASFKTAFSHIPVKTGEKMWEWTYTVEGFSGAYTARLTGEIITDSVEWKMYITKTGIGAFNEFMWYSGKSATDRSGGYWVLNRNNEFPEKMLRIDWKYEDDEVGDIQFTIVRELNDERQPEKNSGAYIHHGRTQEYYNAYYDIHIFNDQVSDFVDVNIRWNRSVFDGQVKSPSFFNDEDWHCWNSDGYDQDCN
ncbi:hypothetical protein [Saccharicrinis sp. FJH54]|uniref:hypothetical protein n=1 Tax=Saccharicrinis sp. FJH54 TaxID=3344665 RepID=UPI0035D4AAB5